MTTYRRLICQTRVLPAAPAILWSVAVGLLLVTGLTLTGCEAVGAAAYAVQGGEPVKKKFELQPMPTLVLVDDPYDQLGRRSLVRTVAASVENYLKQHESVKIKEYVDSKQLTRLKDRLGKDYTVTPIDAIGRQVGAAQVIYVLVEHAKYRLAGDLYQPRAQVRVKVIDVTHGKRLFPEPSDLSPSDTSPQGYPVKVELQTSQIADASRTEVSQYRLALAQRLGRQVSRLFYDWRKPDLGSGIN